MGERPGLDGSLGERAGEGMVNAELERVGIITRGRRLALELADILDEEATRGISVQHTYTVTTLPTMRRVRVTVELVDG